MGGRVTLAALHRDPRAFLSLIHILVVLWIYPRGKAVKAEKDPALIAGAAGVALCLGCLLYTSVRPPVWSGNARYGHR